jgi:hypothetical protein
MDATANDVEETRDTVDMDDKVEAFELNSIDDAGLSGTGNCPRV